MGKNKIYDESAIYVDVIALHASVTRTYSKYSKKCQTACMLNKVTLRHSIQW